METLEKRHPFYYTLGEGPYKYVGSFDLGRVIRAMNNGNIAAYNNGLAELQNWKLERGGGTCSHCGHAILNIQIVQRGDGKLFGVGSDCIMKVADQGDISALSEMERKLRADAKKKRQDRETAKRESMKPAFETSLLVLDKCQHPNEFLAKQGKTYGDYFRFIPKNSKNMKKAIDMAAKLEGKV